MPTDIPENVAEDGTYMLSGYFINQILDVLREQQLSIEDDNSPLQIREIGPGGTVLGIDKENLLPDPPRSGTFALGSIDAIVQWIATQICECGSIDGGPA